MKLRLIAMTGVLSLAGLGLIGAGAHAVFTASTTSNQVISTGAPGVTLTGQCINGTNCPGNPNDLYSVSPDGTTLTFTPGGPYGSSFTTGDEQVTATNTGDIPLTEITWSFNSTYPTSQLATEASVCVTSSGLGTGGNNDLLYNGPLSGFAGTNYGQNGDILTVAGTLPNNAIFPSVATGPTDNYVVDVYAGSEPTSCGSSFTAADGANTANAKVLSIATPGISVTPTLNYDAENQSITISVTMTYQG
jgi:hypothetical protein